MKEVFELYFFPFDYQELNIDLVLDDAHKFDLQIQDIRFKKSCLDHPEWILCAPHVLWHDHTMSKVVLRAARKYFYYVQNIVVVLSVVTFLILVPFGFPVDDMSGRMVVEVTLLLTIVAFQFAITNMVPHTSYNTLMDFYMFFSTVTVAASCGACIIGGHYAYDSEEEGEHVDRIILYCFSGFIFAYNFIWIIASVAVFLPEWFVARPIPYKHSEDGGTIKEYEVLEYVEYGGKPIPGTHEIEESYSKAMTRMKNIDDAKREHRLAVARAREQHLKNQARDGNQAEGIKIKPKDALGSLVESEEGGEEEK